MKIAEKSKAKCGECGSTKFELQSADFELVSLGTTVDVYRCAECGTIKIV